MAELDVHGLSAGGPRYFVRPPLPTCGERFAFREWDEEFVVFDAVTGGCHLLSPAAGSVFSVLLEAARGPLSVDEIFNSTLDDASEALSDPERDGILALLDGLCDVGLVQKVES